MSLIMSTADVNHLLQRSLTDLKAARAELAALKNSLRWHTGPELPAGNVVCVAYVDETPYLCLYDYETEVWFGLDGDEISEYVDRWRPLEVQEVSSK